MKIVNLQFSLQEMQIIAEALREMPYKQVVALLQKIDLQMAKQMNPEPTE